MTWILRCGYVVVPILLLSPAAQITAFAQSDAVRASALIGLARVERDAGRFEAATRAFREASRLRVFDQALLAEFFWTVDQVDPGEATTIGRSVLAISPRDGDVRDRLIELATRAGDETGALALADQGVHVEPTRALWHRRRGESLLRSGAPADAAMAFGQASGAADAMPEDAAQRALALEAAGLWRAAWRAWAMIPEHRWMSRPEWVRSRFRAMAATHAPAEVAPLLVRHLAKHPGDLDLQAQLVEAWASAGRPELALEALDLLPGSMRDQWLRRETDLAHGAGDLPRAVGALKRLRQAGQAAPADAWRLAVMLAEIGESAQARSLLTELQPKAKRCAEEPLMVLQHLSDVREFVAAVRARPWDCRDQIAWIEQAIQQAVAAHFHQGARELIELPIVKIDTAAPKQRELYGQLLLWTGEPRLAIPVLERVLQLLPNRAAAANALIDALRAVGRVDEAWQHAQKQLSRGAVSVSQQLTWAEVALEARHAEDALRLAKSLLSDPDVADQARILVGRALFGLSQPADAREVLRASLPAHADAMTVLALVDSIGATEGIDAALEEARHWCTRNPTWRDVIARCVLWERLVGDRASADHWLQLVEALDAHRAALLRSEIALAEWRPLDAEQILTTLLSSHPDDTDGLDLLSTALAGQRRWEEALVLVSDLERWHPAEIAWKIRRAEWIYRRAPSASALQALEDLVKGHARRLDARLALAGCYADAGKFPQALVTLGNTVAEWSGLPEPGRGLAASLLRQQGRHVEALQVLQAAPVFSLAFRVLRAELLAAEHGPEAADAEFALLAEDPRADPSTFFLWASAHQGNRRHEILEHGLRRFPSDSILAEELAVRRWAAGDAQRALEAAELTLAHDDSRMRAWFVKIETFGQLHPERHVDDVLGQFEARFANEPGAMLAMADVLSSRSQIGDTRAVEAALGWTRRLWDGGYQQTTVLMTQARLYGALGRWEDALGVVDAVLRTSPESLPTLKERAQLLSYTGRFKESVAAYDVYLAKAPDDLAARRQQARVEGWRQAHEASLRRYAQLIEDAPAVQAVRAEAEAKRAFYRGEWTQAIAAYGRWLELEPDNVEARFELAQSYDFSRRPVVAKQTYGELLSYFPPHRQAHAAYERLERRQAVSVQPFAEAQSADGYEGQRLLELFDTGLKISDDLGAGYGTRFSVVGAMSRAGGGQELFSGRLVTAQAIRSRGPWRVSGLAGARSFPKLGGNTPVAQASLLWWPAEAWQLGAGFDRAPIMENLETLRRNIASYGPFASLTFGPARDSQFAARAAWDSLTDGNQRRFARVEGAHRFLRGSSELRAVASAEHLAYRAPTDLYFSPRSFWREDVGIEWRQRLTALEFYGDRDRSLVVRYTVGVDDRRVTYHTARLNLAYEFLRGMALTGQAQWIRSSVYNSSAFVLAIRFGGQTAPSE